MSARLVVALCLALAVLGATGLALRSQDRTSGLDDLLVTGSPRYVDADIRAATPVTRSGGRPTAGAPAIDAGWLARTARAAGLPAAALRAYARAQLTAPDGCHVGWTTLAGIGYVESQHGTIGGRTLEADGRSSSPILGPALDGHGDFAAIRSTHAAQSLHGDAVWEHAVGPMQFLPETWDRWGADGDADGRADPLDLDDAATAAADYLCASGDDLSTSSGWTRAVFSYNHAAAYVRAVYDAASAYSARAPG